MCGSRFSDQHDPLQTLRILKTQFSANQTKRPLTHTQTHTAIREQCFASGVRVSNPTRMYVSWWRAAWFTSAIDVARDIVADVNRHYGRPQWLQTLVASVPAHEGVCVCI